MPELTPAFEEKKGPPDKMGPEAYLALVKDLLAHGDGRGKTQNVAAYLMRDILIATETSEGEIETTRSIKVEPAYILLDVTRYQTPEQQELVIRDIGRNWAGKVIRERDLNSFDYQGKGIWINKKSAVEFDYRPVEPENPRNAVREPNPEAYRVCIETAQPINFPVVWIEDKSPGGGFYVAPGGTVAVRERDFQKLADAVRSIEQGGKSIEAALYTTNEEGKQIALVDVYGMEPNIANTNGPKKPQYDPITLKDATLSTQADFAAAPQTPSPAGPRLQQ